MSEDQSGSEAAEEKRPRTGAKEIEGAARKGPKPLRGKGRDTGRATEKAPTGTSGSPGVCSVHN